MPVEKNDIFDDKAVNAGTESMLGACASWSDVRRFFATLTKQQKGTEFEQLVKLVLQLHPTYRTKLESIWLRRDVPLDVVEHLALPLGDKGIDLEARPFDG